jgi:hypothetical protein
LTIRRDDSGSIASSPGESSGIFDSRDRVVPTAHVYDGPVRKRSLLTAENVALNGVRFDDTLTGPWRR